MLRKMKKPLTAITASAMMVFSLLQGAPAQAWPDSTTAVSTLTSTDERYDIGAIGKTLTSNMVFAYMGAESGVQYIRAYTVSPTGNLTAPVDIARTSSPNVAYQFNPTNSTWVDPFGTFHVLYTQNDYRQITRTSSLLHVTSKDGISWTTPVVIATTSFTDTDTCAQGCGIGQISLSHTLTGQLALIYAVLNANGSKQLFFTTRLPGKSWVTPASINSSLAAPYSVDLQAVGKGFIATWVDYLPGNTRLMSAFSTGLTSKSWTAPQERRNATNVVSLDLIQSSPTKFALVYGEASITPGAIRIAMQTFDTRTNRFGTAQEIAVVPDVNYFFNVIATEYRAGQSALVFNSYSNSADGIDARYILFRNGIATIQFVNQTLATIENASEYVDGASMDYLGHLSIVWSHDDPSHTGTGLFLSQYFRGNRSDVTLGDTIANYNVGFSQDDDVYISSFWNSTISGFVRIRSDAPTLTSDVAVKGTSKVGKTIVTKLPTIDADSLLQRWLYSYQWYSCQYQVTEATNIETNNCSVISGATAAAYKVKPADKGKFLQVKLTVKSDNATQVQYSASTLVVK